MVLFSYKRFELAMVMMLKEWIRIISKLCHRVCMVLTKLPLLFDQEIPPSHVTDMRRRRICQYRVM